VSSFHRLRSAPSLHTQIPSIMSQSNSSNNSSHSNSNNSDNKSTYPSTGLPPPAPLTGMTEAVYRRYMSEYGLVPAIAWVSEETLQQRQ
jgi:hypothetical protein